MKKINLIYSALILLICSCSKDLDDEINQNFNNETGTIQLSPLDEITKDSELFNNLLQIATDGDRPDQNITCIDFNYPLSIFIFNENDEFTLLSAVLDDDEFSSLLENLDPEFSISVSFPIAATIETGEEFIINTREELKQSIDNCLIEEIVRDCNQLLENCMFKVGYSFNFENTYLGGIFEESNGFTTFNFEEENSIGSWTALVIEDELFVNINLVDVEPELSEFFNHNWKVEYIDENSLRLTNDERNLILNQKCNQEFDFCRSFHFEVCENDPQTEVSDFILSNYSLCIIDTLEVSEESILTFHETIEDAENNTNAILDNEVYNNTENNQSIFVKIIDEDSMSEYIIEIILVSISC